MIPEIALFDNLHDMMPHTFNLTMPSPISPPHSDTRPIVDRRRRHRVICPRSRPTIPAINCHNLGEADRLTVAGTAVVPRPPSFLSPRGANVDLGVSNGWRKMTKCVAIPLRAGDNGATEMGQTDHD
jgi:hypothetical protein